MDSCKECCLFQLFYQQFYQTVWHVIGFINYSWDSCKTYNWNWSIIVLRTTLQQHLQTASQSPIFYQLPIDLYESKVSISALLDPMLMLVLVRNVWMSVSVNYCHHTDILTEIYLYNGKILVVWIFKQILVSLGPHGYKQTPDKHNNFLDLSLGRRNWL